MEGGGLFTVGLFQGTAETFQTSFIFDAATLLVSDMSFTAQGLLGGGFVFAGVTQFDSQTNFE